MFLSSISLRYRCKFFEVTSISFSNFTSIFHYGSVTLDKKRKQKRVCQACARSTIRRVNIYSDNPWCIVACPDKQMLRIQRSLKCSTIDRLRRNTSLGAIIDVNVGAKWCSRALFGVHETAWDGQNCIRNFSVLSALRE